MKTLGNILWGIVFIVVGSIFALNALEITNINIFFEGWWTLFIIVPCFIGLIKEREKMGNFIGLVIGVSLLLACQNVIDFTLLWKLMFPTILIMIGISLIFRDTFHQKIKKEIDKINKNNKNGEEYCATFGEQNIRFDQEEFHGATLTAVFGEVKCDLRNAQIKKDVVINVSAIFGSVEILVPEDVIVKIKSTPIFGSVSDKTVRKSGDNQVVLYVNASAIFGEVEIR